MKTFDYKITDPVGIHARPAGVLVRNAESFESKITIEAKGKEVDMKKLLALMELGIKFGDTVTVKISGPDEDTAIEKFETLFKETL